MTELPQLRLETVVTGFRVKMLIKDVTSVTSHDVIGLGEYNFLEDAVKGGVAWTSSR